MNFRLSSQQQKDTQLAILRDLLVDHADDQLAKTVLSNSIAVIEGTMVTGELDAMIEHTDKMARRTSIVGSVFFVAIGVAEFAWAYIMRDLGSAMFALCICFFAVGMHSNYRRLLNYHSVLKWLEDMQTVLPSTPVTLRKVN